MNHPSNVVRAFLSAPLIPASFAVLSTPAFHDQGALTFVGFLALFYLVSAVVVLLTAFPAYLLLSHRNKVNSVSILSAGLVIGIAAGLVFPLPANPNFLSVLRMGLVGIATALCFWLVWRRG